ncbi:GNAT family N-acetyltransferase [Tianweitania sp. BSSL-BM11]|uniref:GNAT family N-acetyltransferase n=1 Tax=Tianweitania aestuarii TaxID=2814886 RepID=A0ABS5RWQ4_9HYPH|nr:GNAT family N-acetyltransferase [Tianweitania aestuarii]MBS9721488.1 GNAT family N-acetyltransferase [Tianweitania aestuarii]
MTRIIQTSRLILHTPSVDDLSSYLAYRNDPMSLQALGMSVVNEAQGLAFLHKQSELETGASGWHMFGIERLEQAGLIGEVGVFLPQDNPKLGDLGWWLHPDHRRMGYAAEAEQGLAKRCFSELELERVTAACLADNVASRSVMERIGMGLEQHTKATRQVGDQWCDEVKYALSRDEGTEA